jgi:hypothetical protein
MNPFRVTGGTFFHLRFEMPPLTPDRGLFKFFVQPFQPLVSDRNFFRFFKIFRFGKASAATGKRAGVSNIHAFNSQMAQSGPGLIGHFKISSVKTGVMKRNGPGSISGRKPYQLKIRPDVKCRIRIPGEKNLQRIGVWGSTVISFRIPAFFSIRSCLSTCRKHGVQASQALDLLFNGKLPDFCARLVA